MTGKFARWAALAASGVALAACDPNRESTANPIWSLHVSERPGAPGRHVATFDSLDSHNYDACEAARAARQTAESGSRTYRCEVGRGG